MDEKNKLILLWIKRLIEDGMENEIDEDEFIPVEIINKMASLHSDIESYMNITN